VDDPAPNAFATGRDPQHAVVAVTTGILGLLNDTELEGVIAHELSHIGNRDMLVATVAVVLVGFVAIVADFVQHSLLWGGGNRDSKNGVVVVIVALAIAILAPLAATLMQLAVSRKREFLADASGALLTRYPEGLASALQKISSYSGGMRRQSSATAHLFIANPLGGENERDKKKTPFLRKIFATHPPVEERVAALMEYRKEY
jgi:heat shock protein HtpX